MSAALLTVLACQYMENREPYYTGKAPSVDGVAGVEGTGVEIGNLGGSAVSIQGSGFGDDVTGVAVFFGSTNAVIESVTDGEIVALSPKGPIGGGTVDVRVATPGGVGVLEDGYLYDVTDLYDDQVAYIQVNDYHYSFMGGSSGYGALDAWTYDGQTIGGLDKQLVFIGQSGYDGTAGLYGSRFPRVHSVSHGWSGGADWAEDWAIETPAYSPYIQWTDDLREELPTPDEKIRLRNPALAGADFCFDKRSLGTWSYPGDDEHGSLTLPRFEDQADNNFWPVVEGDCDDGATFYDASVMEICEVEEYQEDSNAYEVEYPLPIPFFVAPGEGAEDPEVGITSCFDGSNNDGNDEEPGSKVKDWADDDCHSCFDGVDNDEDGLIDGEDDDCHPTIVLDAENTGLHDVALTLPEPMKFTWVEGFETNLEEGVPELWGYPGALAQGWPSLGLDECFDSKDDDDLVADLDEAGLRLTWRPSAFEPSDDPSVVDVRTHVRVAITALNIGWFGGEGYPYRASIQVDDYNNYDTDFEGLSYLDVPVDVLYQLPDVGFPGGGCTPETVGGTFECRWNDPALNEYGYLFITVDRVTEYRLSSEHPKVGGDLIFSYNSADFGYQSWDHPIDNSPCFDCEDGDGDGWPDQLDPDCTTSDAEDGSAEGTYSCNDLFDNDEDGLIDQEDPDCTTGFDVESGECSDGEDNDGDGWIDELDEECLASEPGVRLGELGNDTAECTDGLDNDGDGWADVEDPGCLTGADLEQDGVGGDYECNDGIDNDGNGDIDAEDPGCVEYDAGFGTEQPEFSVNCADDEDDDADGYIDAFDPDCEYFRTQETATFHTVEDYPLSARACYDGEDNDGDGLADAADPGCWAGAWIDQYDVERGFAPTGWMDDEADDGTCTDGVDSDGDSLVDGDDPDCVASYGNAELGASCGDGLDNDGDGWFDSLDPDCATSGDAEDDSSGRVDACSDGEDNDGDGLTDAEDPGCNHGLDISEFG